MLEEKVIYRGMQTREKQSLRCRGAKIGPQRHSIFLKKRDLLKQDRKDDDRYSRWICIIHISKSSCTKVSWRHLL